jgi:hypothetical protein
MPLADLQNLPNSAEDWSVWSYSHRDQHNLIRNAIQASYGTNLNFYPIDPIDLSDFDIFLNYNQQAHDDMNGVLGTRGSDLLQLDYKDKRQLQAWIYLHYQEHYTASAALKVT